MGPYILHGTWLAGETSTKKQNHADWKGTISAEERLESLSVVSAIYLCIWAEDLGK